MKPRNFDIYILLALLLLFSIGLNQICAGRSQDIKKEPESPSIFKSLTINVREVLSYLRTLLMSGSVSTSIELLGQFPPQTSYGAAKHIIENEQSLLNDRSKQQLIFGLASKFAANPTIQSKLFDLLLSIKLQQDESFLINAVKDGYKSITPALCAWAQTKQTTHPELTDFEKNALYIAIDNNNFKEFTALHEQKICPDKPLAADLLWYTVKTNGDARFIPYFVQHRAQLTMTKDGHTLITLAVENNNKAAVEKIVAILSDQGKSEQEIATYINRFASPQIGTPLQLLNKLVNIEGKREYIPLELYIREVGGVE